MTYPAYLRQRALQLRLDKGLSLDEIAQRLALPKTTVYYWIKGTPLGRPRRENGLVGSRRMQAKYRRLREAAYEQGLAEYDELVKVPTFRDFVVLYIAEGSKRNRNRVVICNSDARMVALAVSWLSVLTQKPLTFSLQYHADQNLDQLRSYWSEAVGVDGAAIRLQRKSNSGQLAGRKWRSQYGVLTVSVNDTLLRARLQAWIDRVREDWALDSAGAIGA